MIRFKFEHGDNTREFYIYDTAKGQAYPEDCIAIVYDVDLAQKIVNLLNGEAGKEYLCQSTW